MGKDKSIYEDEYFLLLDEKRKIIKELNNEPYIEHWKNNSLEKINGEVWVDINIDGIRGDYQISNYERVKALSRSITKQGNRTFLLKEKIRKHVFDKKTGYRCIMFKNIGKNIDVKYSIHILMAFHFVSNKNKDKYKQVNHITGNKWDNRPKNLEWVTRSQDLIHKYHILNYKFPDNRKGINSNCSKKIIQKDINGNFVKEWNSQGDIERELGLKQSNISRACNKNNAISHGFK